MLVNSLRLEAMMARNISTLRWSSRLPQGPQRFALVCASRMPGTGRLALLNRMSTTATSALEGNLRKRLTSDLKHAMKAKDTFQSTVLRSVLSDIYAADKTPAGPIPDSSIVSILRKSVARRVESATQFTSASRPDLADTEQREATLLSSFFPPPMSSAQIDEILARIFNSQRQEAPGSDLLSNPKRATGLILKAFYSQVDKSLVDSQTIKDKVEALLSSSESSSKASV